MIFRRINGSLISPVLFYILHIMVLMDVKLGPNCCVLSPFCLLLYMSHKTLSLHFKLN